MFNILEEVVTDSKGADLWDDLLADAGLDGAYTSLGSYPEEHLIALVSAASERIGLRVDEVVRWFGQEAVARFATRYPRLFEGHAHTRSFVLTLNDIIHPEVRKLYPGADVPEFDFLPAEEGRLVMGYRSPRKLCAFAEGLLHGSAAHFGERAEIAQEECMLRGDERCVLDIAFHRA